MAGIYWFVFTQVFQRTVGNEPYIVFLLSALLPWMWFNGAVSDSTRAFLREAKLIRSTRIPRTIWVNRLVLSKGIEFVASLPVLVLFAVIYGAPINADAIFFPLAMELKMIGNIIQPPQAVRSQRRFWREPPPQNSVTKDWLLRQDALGPASPSAGPLW